MTYMHQGTLFVLCWGFNQMYSLTSIILCNRNHQLNPQVLSLTLPYLCIQHVCTDDLPPGYTIKVQLSSKLMHYIKTHMQTPLLTHMSPQTSIFQAILEQFSLQSQQHQVNYMEREQPSHVEQQPAFYGMVLEERNVWFRMQEIQYETCIQSNQEIRSDLGLQFKRVKSLREEQETKVASFLRQDKYKSLKNIEIPAKESSPMMKSAQSLSPRKTKKIDKSKQQKFTFHYD